MDVTADQVFNIATSVIATASVIAAVFPTPVVNPVLIAANRILNIFAFNFRNAKNAEVVK
jgi:hypothetical protein